MNSDFRERVLLPIILPLGVLAAIVGIAFSLSRVMLAVEEMTSVFIALMVAGYILLIAFLIERRPRISSRALAVGMTLGLIGIVSAGTVAAVAGPRAIEEHGEAAPADEGGGEPAEGEGEPEGGAAAAEDVPEDAAVFTAGQELAYTEAPSTIPAGEAEIALVLEGLPHNVVFEGVEGDEPIAEGDSAGVFTGTVELDPGEYTYYCSVPGHRAGGMEGTVTVS
ncbi:MAG: hypothetical protein GEU81_10400 [Nitriliruptorales bacterium]|nr:hypothetical protein [Nitriliruptorales bacterium]